MNLAINHKPSTQISDCIGLADRFRCCEGERRVFRRREKMTVWQHAEKYRVITDGNIKGPWKNNVTPYTVGPMHCWTMPSVRKIFLIWAPQSAKTQVAFNCIIYAIEHDGLSVMYVMPNEKVTKRISKRRIIPMFKASPAMRELLGPRFDDVTALAVSFINGADLMMAWATSAAELSSESVPIIILDERDKFDDFSGKEADPTALSEIRSTTFPYTSKLLEMSTPVLEDGIASDIKAEADVVYRYAAKCPVCGEYQIMEFENIILKEDLKDPREIIRRRLAYYQCRTCGMLWDDHMRNQAVLDGMQNPDSLFGWIPDRVVEDPIAVAFHLPSWYSPFVSLSRVKAAEIRGRDDRAKEMVFVNQHKAEPFIEVVDKPKKEDELLKARAMDLAPQTVPATALALTFFADVQKSGFWFAVRAWARDIRGLTGWLIHYGAVATWGEIENLLYETEYPIVDGSGTMRIWRAGFDTGGGKKYEDMSMTEETYWWIIANFNRGVQLWGTKGSSRPIPGLVRKGEALLKTPSGKKLPDWFHLALIDTEKIKDLFHYGIDQAISGGGNALYLHRDTDEIYAKHILAEEKRMDKKSKTAKWERIRATNHLLDADCGCVALAQPQWLGGGVNILAPRVASDPGKKPVIIKKAQKNKTSRW
ncbi:MAG: terminase gpA endonuclease subunit [Smithella sp.]